MREMKDSGIEWIGEIPKEWGITNFGNVSEIFGRIGFRGYTTNDLVGKGDGPITLSPSNIIENKLSLDNCSYISWEKYEESPEIKIYKNDIILVKTASVGKCAIYNSQEPATLNPQLVVLKKIKCNSKYLYYQIISDIIQVPIMLDNFGSVIPTITQKNLKCYKIVFPPTAEQQKISTYLDTKCTKIDSIIEKQEKVIEKLKEYKLSVITEAVTKGLNPDVKMKDSGVEWIGEIPEEWEVIKAKYCVLITNGSDPKTEGNIPVYGSGSSSFKTCGEFKEGPCVLIGRKGATLHIPHYILGKYWNVDTAFDVKSLDRILLKFYYFLAICFDYKIFMSQTTLPSMTQTAYENMILPIPSIEEQTDICNYLDKKCSAIDKSIEQKQAIIEKLKEYKKSLIYEVVTGKREV